MYTAGLSIKSIMVVKILGFQLYNIIILYIVNGKKDLKLTQ